MSKDYYQKKRKVQSLFVFNSKAELGGITSAENKQL